MFIAARQSVRREPLLHAARMAYAFDTLGYAKRLRDAGVPQQAAEGHAEAAREFVMAELVTRTDLEVSEQITRTLLESARRDLEASVAAVRSALEATRRDLEGAMERQTLRMTVRLGGMIGFAIAVLAAIVKL